MSICFTKFVTLAHPPNPKPTTNTQITMKAFTRYIAAQLGMKNGGFSAAFYNKQKKKRYSISVEKKKYKRN